MDVLRAARRHPKNRQAVNTNRLLELIFSFMKVNLSAQNEPQQFLALTARSFGVQTERNHFRIPPQVGNGEMRQFYFFPGFTLTYLNFRLLKPLEFIRIPVDFPRRNERVSDHPNSGKTMDGTNASSDISV